MKNKISKWLDDNRGGVLLFNLSVLLLALLQTAGYFHPFFRITINFVILTSMILAIFLLHAGSRALFYMSFAFLLLTIFFKTFGVNVWSDRVSIYIFESMALASLMFIYETWRKA